MYISIMYSRSLLYLYIAAAARLVHKIINQKKKKKRAGEGHRNDSCDDQL